MNRLFAIPGLILCLLAANTNAHAQTVSANTYDFIPREKVIFEDDFSKDSIGAFPHKWKIGPYNNNENTGNTNSPFGQNTSKSWFTVQRSVYGNILTADKVTGIYFIQPAINTLPYINDSFTLEFDFVMGNDVAVVEVGFEYHDNDGNLKTAAFTNFSFREKHMVFTNTSYTPKYEVTSVNCPDQSKYYLWHHYSITYNKKHLKCYIDQYRLLDIPDCGYSPGSFCLSIYTPASIKNVRLATGRENTGFNKIITDNKFVTHAINFDVNKSTIQPRSMGFITQLAQFLKSNPTIKLEIDGHTDSDGDADANLKLSQARADEVKKQLAAMGIDAARLTAKGLGPTKPIKPNTTPENKAENRRVEFIKL